MTKKYILKNIEQKFPEIFLLPKQELDLIVKAILYAASLAASYEQLNDEEHKELINIISRKGKSKVANSLLAYRLREAFTEKRIIKKILNIAS